MASGTNNLVPSITNSSPSIHAREMLAEKCPLSLVRDFENADDGSLGELWSEMANLGWLGLAFPEEYGGAGGNFMDLAVLVEEMGRALTPGPFFSTVVLGGLTILDGGDEAKKAEFLPGISEGKTMMTLALTEESSAYSPDAIQVSACIDGEELVIEGTKLFVPDAKVADYIIVAARACTDNIPQEDITLAIVPNGAKGLNIRKHESLGLDKQYEVTFEGVRIPSSSVVGEIGKGWPILDRALQRAAAAKCIEMVGGSDAVLDMTLDFLKQRVQFGRPVATFQGVQHHCANMATDAEGCRNIAYQAVWMLAQKNPADREVSLAKSWISDAYLRICSLAHQCHGAIGFTKEHDLQLYTRKARVQEQEYGDTRYHRYLLSQLLTR
ncbi:acyl-CoA dehydrogenase [SAR202 cluster bacterium AD-804-J14_MRT_500m]|nr:acyl-CoA dehydrogenase [SAR202 cluster bacterium AD-804-J14_MRT_500m]